jgi:hypothetical protein
VLGEEIFGEAFRSFVAGQLGLDIERKDAGSIMWSFGIGELRLHLCYETPATISLSSSAAGGDMAAYSLDLRKRLLRNRRLHNVVDSSAAGSCRTWP